MFLINEIIVLLPVLVYPLINFIILFLLGFGLTFLVLPRKLRRFWFWLSPWTVLISAIFYFTTLSLLGISITKGLLPFVILIICANIFTLVKLKPKFNFNFKSNLILAVIVSLTLILNISPLIKQDKMLTTISMGNNDVIAYVVASDYLKNHTIRDSFLANIDPAVSTLLQNGYRWGPPILNAFFLKILNLQGY